MPALDRSYAVGLLLVLVVCIIWTFASVLVQRVERAGVSPFALTYVHRADTPQTNRGDAAAATWIFRGELSRRRRGRDVDIPRRAVAAPRLRRGI